MSISCEVLALIPARGGSKGIPRKNVQMLAGKPLIAHTIMQACQARSITRVVVSTDDPEIAAVSHNYGAEVIWRPAELSGDTASSESALLHALEHLRLSENYNPDLLVFLQCTSPLTTSEDIDNTVHILIDQGADSALTATPFHYFLWRAGVDGNAVGINHNKAVRLRRQDRDPQYLETGAVYVMRTLGFIECKHRFFGKTVFYIMPPERCLEIDERNDLKMAEVILQERQRHRHLDALPDPVAALVLDFDGVFTDNRVLVFQDGHEAVLCHRGDGWGLSYLKQLDLPLLVISTEQNSVVKARCDKLGIPVLQGVQDKLSALTMWSKQQQLSFAHIVFLGNDVNDLACLKAVGCSVVVSDAHSSVRSAAHFILEAKGGEGAIRELADLIAFKLKEK